MSVAGDVPTRVVDITYQQCRGAEKGKWLPNISSSPNYKQHEKRRCLLPGYETDTMFRNGGESPQDS